MDFSYFPSPNLEPFTEAGAVVETYIPNGKDVDGDIKFKEIRTPYLTDEEATEAYTQAQKEWTAESLNMPVHKLCRKRKVTQAERLLLIMKP